MKPLDIREFDPERVKMLRFTSPDFPQHATYSMGVAKSRPRVLKMVYTLLSCGLGAVLMIESGHMVAPALAQSSALTTIEAQIRQYGCNQQQYRSVEGCRQLHARARALRSAGHRTVSPSRLSAPSYRTPYPSAPRPRSAPPTSPGGIFGFLFGPAEPDLYRKPGHYNSNRDRYYSPSYNTAPTGYGRYRTMCVRMCDGYYFPISNATSSRHFKSDAQRCELSCSSPAKLFYHSSYGGSPANMVDMQGRPYSTLENAFLYREKYIASCKCKPDPWSDQAREEYAARADDALAKVVNAGDDAVLQQAEVDIEPRPVQATAQPAVRRQRRGWSTFLPFARWTNGG